VALGKDPIANFQYIEMVKSERALNMEIGKAIGGLRRQRGMTLKQLSEKAAVSLSLLSVIERDISAPTVRTLERIVKALGTSVSSLYLDMEKTEKDTENSAGVSVLRKKDRKKLQPGPERGTARYEMLTADYQRKLEFMYIHFPVKGKPAELLTHEGEECGVILEGRLKVVVDKEEYILEEGDSIYFESTAPHSMVNIGDIEVRAFWVNTPPTF
jgi:transcriptional regulator with XRE-family HTH domain